MANDVFQDVDGAVKKLLPQLEAVQKAIKGVSTELIALDKTTKTTAKNQSDLKQKTSQLSAVDKQLIKLDKQLEAAEAQLTEEYKQVQKAVLKKKEAVKQSNDELKKQAGIVKKASTELTSLEKTTKNVAKSQSDLKAKSSQLSDVDKELIKLDKQMAVAEAKLTNEYKQVQKALIRKQEAQKKAAAAIREEVTGAKAAKKAAQDQRKAAQELNRAHAEAIKINNKLNQTQKKSGGLFKSMTKSILAAGTAMFGINAAIGAVKRVLGNAFKTIVGFEKGMSEVKAITNATDKEFLALVESAKKLGSVTPKTATEVSGLQKEFAKLGFSTAEILAATEATISLSIAAGADLSQSATVAASTIRGFGLSANETQRVVDVMAKSFSSSALDLNKFQVAMATVAPVAKNAGFSLEKATAILGTLANAGIEASTAGSAFRNIMLDMAEGGFTLDEALERINDGTSKNAEALKAFGKRGATVASVLAGMTDETSEFARVLTEEAQGAAQEMADIMADNLAGDIDKAKSAWEGLILSFEDGNGVLAKLGRGVIQSWTQQLSDLTRMTKGLDAARKDELESYWETVYNKVKEQFGVEKTLEKALEIRAIQLKKISDLEAELETASGRKSRLIEKELDQRKKTVDAQLKVIENLQNGVKANEDAEKAKTEALIEQERIRTKLAEEEAQRRADARERIQLKAAKKRADFLNQQGEEEVDDYIEQLTRENESFEELLTERGEINIEAIRTQLTAEEEAIKVSNERKLEMQKQLEDGKKELIDAGINAAEKIITDRFNAGIDERLNSTLEGIEADQELLKDQLDKKQITEEQFKKKSKALNLKARQEEAKANKKKSQFDNVINTLVAVGKTFATLGFPAGVIPAAIVAGIGAANGIAIAAEPIPKFRLGKDNFEGGLADVHTGEIIKLADGSMFETPVGETRMYLPPATDVIPAHKAETIIKENNDIQQIQQIKPEIINYSTTITEGGMHFSVNRANSRNNYANKYMRQV
jgi:hypothetical protein